MKTPTTQELLNDPCTPYWAKDVIRVALLKDPCDAANVLAMLAKVFDKRANDTIVETEAKYQATRR